MKERNIEATAERELNSLKGDAAAAARDPQFRTMRGREYASSSEEEEKDDDDK